MGIGDRIKTIRLGTGLSQSKFADKLHVRQATVAAYENAKCVPSEAVIANICRVYDINDNWLRNGEGEMRQPMTLEEELTDALADLLKGSEESKKRLILALAKLPEEWYETLEECVTTRYGNGLPKRE